MLSFSQRKGIKPIRTIIQLDSVDDALRNQLWNCLIWGYWNMQPEYFGSDPVSILLRRIWIHYYDLRIDEIGGYPSDVISKVKHDFLNSSWDTMYSILEFIPNNYKNDVNTNNLFTNRVNTVLEKYLSGYRFVNNVITDITSEQEIDSIEVSLRDTSLYKPVHDHLQRALELLSDRQNPDYRNSIKESISAVESLCSIITAKPKATLGQALAQIEKSHELHSALKSSFSSLYGWTSDADGIRHKLLEQSKLKQEDAKFMLIACSAFINYLLTKTSYLEHATTK